MHDVELFVMVDCDGNFVVSTDRDGISEKWEEEIGGAAVGGRVLAVKLSVDTSDTCLTATVPADARKATLTVQ